MRVTLRQLQNDLGEHLARVRKGERVLVTLRGTVIAVIAPPSSDREPDLTLDERLDRMAAAGELIRARPAPPGAWDFEPVRLRAPAKARRAGKSKARKKSKASAAAKRRPLTASEIILEQRG